MQTKKLIIFLLAIGSALLGKNDKGQVQPALLTSSVKERFIRDEKHKCIPKVLKAYINLEYQGDDFFRPIVADDSVKKVCPKLSFSCCSGPALEAAAIHFQSVVTSTKQMLQEQADFHKQLKKVGSKKILDTIVSDNVSPSQLQDKASEIDKHRGDTTPVIDDYIANISTLERELQRSAENIANYYSGFLCELCDPALLSKIDIGNDSRSNPPKVKIQTDTMKAYAPMIKENIEFLAKQDKLYDIILTIDKNGLEKKYKIFNPNDKQISQFLALANDCVAGTTSASDIAQNNGCHEILEGGGIYTSENFFTRTANAYSLMSAILRDRFESPSDTKAQDQGLLASQNTPDETLPPYPEKLEFYVIAAQRELTPLEKLKITFVDEDGFDMTHNKLNNDFLKSAAKLAALAATLFLSALCL